MNKASTAASKEKVRYSPKAGPMRCAAKNGKPAKSKFGGGGGGGGTPVVRYGRGLTSRLDDERAWMDF
jgi:hypothetical protein